MIALDPDLFLRRSQLRRLRQRLRAEPAVAEQRLLVPVTEPGRRRKQEA